MSLKESSLRFIIDIFSATFTHPYKKSIIEVTTVAYTPKSRHNKTNMPTTKLTVETRTVIRVLLVVLGFVLACWAVVQLWPAIVLVVVAFFLALVLNPSVSALSRRLPGNSRLFATLIAYLVMLSVIGIFITVAVPPTIQQTTEFIQGLPGYFSDLSHKGGLVADIINRYQLQDDIQHAIQSVQGQVAGTISGIGISVIAGISSFFGGLVTFITVLVLTFLMLVEAPTWLERFWNLYNNKHLQQRHRALATKMYKVVSSYVNGQVVVALIAAGAGLTVLLILVTVFKLDAGILLPLAGVIFITDMIPMFGATIGAVIVVLVLLFGNIGAAIAFTIYFTIYQQIENNFIQPLVQSRSVALSALGIFIAVIVGINLFGILGGILAIPVAGCLRVIIIDFMEHRQKRLFGSSKAS